MRQSAASSRSSAGSSSARSSPRCDGVRRARCRRGARRRPAPHRGAPPARRRRRRRRAARRRPGVDVAGGPADATPTPSSPRRSSPPVRCSIDPTSSPTGSRRCAGCSTARRCDGHLSPTPAGGAGPDDRPPMFDQQPIEAATMADACARAFAVTGDQVWRDGLDRCVDWFLGANDVGVPVGDLDRGAGYDGLERRRCQPQRGHRVDARADHDAATRSDHGAPVRMTSPSMRRQARARSACVPDPSRVLGQLFVPGHALAGEREGRASNTVAHVLGLSDAEVAAALDEIVERFGGAPPRSVGDVRTSRRSASPIGSPDGRRAVRAAPARCSAPRSRRSSRSRRRRCATPARSRHPDQGGLAPGELRVVLSVRQIGEGHRSSIGFRSIVVGSDGDVSIARRGPYTTAGTIEDVELDAAAVRRPGDRRRRRVRPMGARRPRTAFTRRQLARAAAASSRPSRTRAATCRGTSSRLIERASRCYAVRFPAPSDARRARPRPGLRRSSRTVSRTPGSCASSTTTAPVTYLRDLHGLRRIGDRPAAPRRRPTSRRSRPFPLLGAGAANKGLALFPRRIGGRYHALSRCDGERNALAVSDDLRHWPTATPLDVTDRTWSSVQLGNCGSPIELDEGWLVLTHGVGAMRTYSIGALLLDLDDPSIVIGQTAATAASAPAPTTRTATSRTSSTPAARSATATTSSSRSASPTAGSGSPRSPSPTSSPPWATASTARRRTDQEVTNDA